MLTLFVHKKVILEVGKSLAKSGYLGPMISFETQGSESLALVVEKSKTVPLAHLILSADDFFEDDLGIESEFHTCLCGAPLNLDNLIV